jgi:putative transposase
VRGNFVYRLYPTKAQTSALRRTLEECRWLYNYLLEQRKTAWEERRETLRLYDQQNALPSLKAERPSLATVHAQVLQNVAVRLDLAMNAFFRRVQAGKTPGYPRFRGQGRYDSFTFPQAPSGCKLTGDVLHLSKIGAVRVVLHRPLEGTLKTCTIRRSATGKWYASFSCVVAPVPLPPSPEQVGIDVGLTTFATLSTGETIENPRFLRADEAELAKVQRRLIREEKGTPERRRRRKPVARVHERIAFRRTDFAHQTARRIVDRFGLIAVENLMIARMGQHPALAKSIHDAAWGRFYRVLCEKAESAARLHVAVDPAFTSQDCSRCQVRHVLPLKQRDFCCSSCGLTLGRDHNAALNVLALGQQSLGLVPRGPRP